jgi:DNA topoisomerase-1
VLDRLVGYKISPLLWDKVRRGFRRGVQTVALRLIVEREREIRAFQKREYWTLDVNLNAKKPPATDRPPQPRRTTRYPEIPDQRRPPTPAAISTAEVYRGPLGERRRRRSAIRFRRLLLPRLQQESSRKLRFSVKRTMMLAQQAVRRRRAGRGRVGWSDHLHAYRFHPRFARCVDGSSRSVATRSARTTCRKRPTFIKARRTPRTRTKPSGRLRPCGLPKMAQYLAGRRAEAVPADLDALRRFADDARGVRSDHHRCSERQRAGRRTYLFRATGSVPKFNGFLEVYEEGKDQKDEEDDELKHKLPRGYRRRGAALQGD